MNPINTSTDRQRIFDVHSSHSLFGNELRAILEILSHAEKEATTSGWINLGIDFDTRGEFSIDVVGYRLESDREYSNRMKRVEILRKEKEKIEREKLERSKAREEKERQQYEILKKKYG
jgi:hypothetical protein